jgi:anaerobic selenocysteine-containing dehydrogenase
MFGSFGVPGERALTSLALRFGPLRTGTRRSRIGGFPHVLGSGPAALMAKEITTSGPGQIRALFVSSGNPVLSVPNGPELEAALDTLDLMVSIDFYVNETNAHADYVLPATTMYEREDYPLPFQALFTTPFRQATEKVVEPAGEARQEWEIIEDLMRAMWRRSPLLTGRELVRRALGPLGPRLMQPRALLDPIVRLSTGGDRFGLRRGGLTLKRLLVDHPHGKVVADGLSAGVLRTVVQHRDRRVRLDPPEIAAEVERLGARADDPAFPLRLIGMRELRSENSWMHNAPLLMRGGRVHAARMHPDDAASVGVAEGEQLRLESPHGAIELPVLLTDDLSPGVVAVPHGWGHRGGKGRWRTANEAGGANVNELTSSEAADVEPLAGMAHLNGVPIRAMAVAAPAPAEEERATTAAPSGVA